MSVKQDFLPLKQTIKEIEFYDDSESNIRDMQVIKKETSDNGRIEKFDIYNVTEGIPNLT